MATSGSPGNCTNPDVELSKRMRTSPADLSSLATEKTSPPVLLEGRLKLQLVQGAGRQMKGRLTGGRIVINLHDEMLILYIYSHPSSREAIQLRIHYPSAALDEDRGCRGIHSTNLQYKHAEQNACEILHFKC